MGVTENWFGAGASLTDEWKLDFEPHAFLALGSPIAFFLSIRRNAVQADGSAAGGLAETSTRTVRPSSAEVGPEFCFPKCKNFYNLFHPHDPVAYRIEPLLYAELRGKMNFYSLLLSSRILEFVFVFLYCRLSTKLSRSSRRKLED